MEKQRHKPTAKSTNSVLSKAPKKQIHQEIRKSKDNHRILKINPDKREIVNKPYNIFENGINITPKNLTDFDYPNRDGAVSYGRTPTHLTGRTRMTELQSIDSITSARSNSSLSTSASRYSIRRSIISQHSIPYSLASNEEQDDYSFAGALELVEDKEDLLSVRAPSMFRLRQDPPPRKPKVETQFKIDLVESDTMFLLQVESQSDSLETENGKEISELNAMYEKSLEKSKALSHIAVQTTKIFRKHRKLLKPRNGRRNAGTFASVWEIYDTYESMRKNEEDDQSNRNSREEGRVNTIIVYNEHNEYESSFDLGGNQLNKRFMNALMVMERLILKNIYREKQLLYQGLLVQNPFSRDVTYNYALIHLWTFYCELVKKRSVTTMSWNKKNKNILAVGYGKFKFTTKCDGLVCVWNVKSPSIPERLYEFPEDPVTFVTFSDDRWQILAVTFYSGSVFLIDIMARSLLVKANNHHYPLYYPVRQARWFPKEGKATILITCGKGGRIFRYKKSDFFLSNKIMALGRPHGNIHGVEQPRKCFARKVLTSRQPAAEILVRHPMDPQVYLVGSSEGCVYICSVQHRRDYKEIFVAHSGPVYNIQFNPFCSKIFLTCGADCCIRIWAEHVYQPLITLESGMTAVQDALWSPLHSTVIASTAGTFIELWDIRRRISKPMSSSETPTKAYNNVLMFSENKFNLCIGDVNGDVHVMAMSKMPFSPSYQEAVLIDSINAALITKPEIYDVLKKLGPPFVSRENNSDRKAKLRSKLNKLYENI